MIEVLKNIDGFNFKLRTEKLHTTAPEYVIYFPQVRNGKNINNLWFPMIRHTDVLECIAFILKYEDLTFEDLLKVTKLQNEINGSP